jgi:hypothetical protein
MKIGLDIHGVIDRYPALFKTLSTHAVRLGKEVHIITGQSWAEAYKTVENLGICYTHHFSIVDYHKEKGTKMWQNSNGTWQMDNYDWNRSKGDYIWREKIDIHFDDDYNYVNYFPEHCTAIIVPKYNFETCAKFLFDDVWIKENN